MSVTIDQLVALRSWVGLEPPQWLSDDRLVFLSGLSGQTDLWSIPAAGGFPVRLSVGMGSLRFLDAPNVRVAPDRRHIAFISGVGDAAEVFLWSAEGSQVRPLTRVGGHVNAFSWAPDSRRLVFSANRGGAYDIYTVDVDSGVTRQLTRDSRYEVYPVFSADGQHILFVRMDERWVDHEVVAIPTEGGAERVITRDEGMFDYHYGRTFGYPLPTPDGQAVVFRSHRSNWLNYWRVPLDGGDPAPLFAEPADQSEPAFSPDGRWLAYIANYNGTFKLCLLDLATGQRTVLVDPEIGVCALPSWSPDGRRIAYLYQTPTEPVDLWTVDIAGGERRRLTDSRPGGGVTERLVQPEKVVYPSFDGLPISAYVYAPPQREPGRRYPGLLISHGGPTSQITDGLYPMAQYFALQGYVVIMPNFRGSSGYGLDIQDMNRQDFGGGDLKDNIAGVEYLKTLDYVDPTRMAITGTSYGGYMSMAAVVFAPPGAFQASIAASGYADRYRMYFEQELRHVQQLKYKLGLMEDSEAVYRRVSPYYFAQQAHTPIFILHGVGRPPQATDSRSFAEALEKEYKVVQYKTYPGETYYVQSQVNTRQMWLDMQAFLAKYLDL